jgi:hypothetical protein
MTLFYRAEPIIAHLALPHVRHSVIYVFGGKSPLSSPELLSAKLERTVAGIGGSRGAVVGRVKQVILPKTGHLVPMKDVHGCANATSLGLVVLLSDGSWMRRDIMLARKGKARKKKSQSRRNGLRK